jgi:hypothetical protein
MLWSEDLWLVLLLIAGNCAGAADALDWWRYKITRWRAVAALPSAIQNGWTLGRNAKTPHRISADEGLLNLPHSRRRKMSASSDEREADTIPNGGIIR